VFKRIFGEHPEILREFLNHILPFAGEDELIASLEYLPAEQVPQVPLLKNSIVDVRCRDARGRQFIVEMQLAFTSAFMQRVLFNASKAYVRQLDRAERYESLCPVYGLSLLDDVFDHKTDNYYHDYRLVETDEPRQVLEGLRLVFVELPKFRDSRPREARLVRWAWLKFLNEAGDAGEPGHPRPEEFRAEVGVSEPLRQALDIAEECGLDPASLERYERFWDSVRVERTLLHAKHEEGREEGRKEGREEGREEKQLEIAVALKKRGGLSDAEIAAITGLPQERVAEL
jgi:predicted transposase/invertase (TIGR01784 family)